MDAIQRLTDEISDLVMDIRVLRVEAQRELYATAMAYMPRTAPLAVPALEAARHVRREYAGVAYLLTADGGWYAYRPQTPPAVVAPVYVLETEEECAMREEGEQILADALAVESDARWLAGREADAAANARTMTRAQIDAEYRMDVERQYLAAEDYCRGVLLSRTAEAAGVHPRTLFSGPSHVAYARASEELRRYWADVEPRMTLAEFTAHVTGQWTPAAETARHAAFNAWRAA
jgi:hypothetical protein